MEERERQKKNGIERNLGKIMFAGDCGLGAGMVTLPKMSLNGSTNARMDKRGGREEAQWLNTLTHFSMGTK